MKKWRVLCFVTVLMLSSCALFQKQGLGESDYHALRVKLLIAHAKGHVISGEVISDDEYAEAKTCMFIIAATLKGEPIHYSRGIVEATISVDDIVIRLCQLQSDLENLIKFDGGTTKYNDIHPKSMTRVTLSRMLGEFRQAAYTGDLDLSEEASQKLLRSKFIISK